MTTRIIYGCERHRVQHNPALSFVLSLLISFFFLNVDGFENKSQDLAQVTDGSPGTSLLESLGMSHTTCLIRTDHCQFVKNNVKL